MRLGVGGGGGEGWERRAADAACVLCAALVAAGVAARIAGLPLYVAESGDEWGNMVASFRVLYGRGDAGAFIHPALYYDVTAVAYAAVYAVVRVFHLVDGAPTVTDLLLRDERIFVYTARAVSVSFALLGLLVLFRFAAWLWSRRSGWFAAALLAVLPLHVLYAKTVRVDSLFTTVFLYASWRLVRLLDEGDRRAMALAAAAVGLATAANYNGAFLLPWLVAALWGRRDGGAATPLRRIAAALVLAAAVFLVCNPYVVLNATTFARDALIQGRLAAAAHPGWEGRDGWFYVRDLLRLSPTLAALVVAAVVAFAACGSRRERFLVSIPASYMLLFSLIRTREDRFALPALALLLLLVAGLPSLVQRRLAARPRRAAALSALWGALAVVAIVAMAPAALTLPQPRPHENLPRFEAGILAWIETEAPRGSTILVESGVVPLLDTMQEGDAFAAALRRSAVVERPGLDHRYLGAVYLAGCNYDVGVVERGEIDYAVVSLRNERALLGRCAEFPAVCNFYAVLRAQARIALEAPDGFEPVAVYSLRRR